MTSRAQYSTIFYNILGEVFLSKGNIPDFASFGHEEVEVGVEDEGTVGILAVAVAKVAYGSSIGKSIFTVGVVRQFVLCMFADAEKWRDRGQTVIRTSIDIN